MIFRASLASILALFAAASAQDVFDRFKDEPRPEGISVLMTELEGAVFTDEEGSTLYIWPQHLLRNGYSGEQKGRIECYDIVRTTTAGLMSPYPPGVLLPELDTRPSCTDLWHPLLAQEGAEPIGKWSVIKGQDGRRQWAYDEQPVYTSHLDEAPGDTIGGTKRRYGGEGAAARNPVGPLPRVPPAFRVMTTAHGGLLMTKDARSVYVLEGEFDGETLCDEACTDTWHPLTAPALARGDGLFSLIERSAGVRQWAYRGQPLYTYALDSGEDWMVGSDVPGWSNTYLWETPEPPSEFTTQDTIAGEVLADAGGQTIYLYSCGDDSIDQLGCDHPTDPQVYRLAICGQGDPQECQQNWRYVPATDDAQSTSRTWRPIWIDPKTGRFAQESEEGSIRVWAYRDRPVYTYFLDKKPGDVRGDATGEWRGGRNGLKAFWVRNAFFRGQ